MKNPMDKNGIVFDSLSRNDVAGRYPQIRTAAGAPVENNQDSMTAGPRGPLTLQDTWFLEKMAHFDREVIPGAAHARQRVRRFWHLHGHP